MKTRRWLWLSFSLLLLVSLLTSCLSDYGGADRFAKPLVFKISGSSAATRNYSVIIQNSLKDVGIPVEIETVEQNTLFDQLRQGQYNMTTSRWLGGNQDPIFLKDLFVTGAPFNRGRYSNPKLDEILNKAVATADRAQARELYVQAQDIISSEVPMLPLWYVDNMVISRKGTGNIKPDAGGDFIFLSKVTTDKTGEPFVVAIESNPETLDAMRGTDGPSERLRQLMHSTLVRKNENFDYVPELADFKRADDGLSYTFTLKDGVKFHNGNPVTAKDVKYSLDALLASDSRKATPFFEGTGDKRVGYVTAVEATDPRTVVVRLRSPWLQLLPNLTPMPIIPDGSADKQRETPMGCGPFKFVSYDRSQQVVDMEANDSYFGGVPKIRKLRVRVVSDANTMQAEFKSGRVDLAAALSNLSPDGFKTLGEDPNLKVEQFPGANIVYLGFNAESEPLKDARLRQAIAYAIDREAIVRDLLLGQGRVAHSILPESSWAYSPGQKYTFDPARARKILDDAGYVKK
ncbi:MAG: peptide/nickel transport system substrate-binding protein [Blastocatellia bacterium]|jgi:ABC-type transport system substrate-binding protein|nr:peptide/nickel transport system substrate-binding protein [Blastocatellia bacterium]